MLSTQYRLRLEGICKSIAASQEVNLEDMIWAEKLSKANTSARGMLSQARRLATDSDSTFLKYLDIGCLLYTSPSPRDATLSRMPSSA